MPLNWFGAAYVGSAVLLTLRLVVKGDRSAARFAGLPSVSERGGDT